MQELGWNAPEAAHEWVALVILAAVTGFVKSYDHRPTEEEFEIVGDAVTNADRYYRLVGMSASQRQEDADRMAAAFKITAAAWFQQHKVNSLNLISLSAESYVHARRKIVTTAFLRTGRGAGIGGDNRSGHTLPGRLVAVDGRSEHFACGRCANLYGGLVRLIRHPPRLRERGVELVTTSGSWVPRIQTSIA